MEKPRDDSGGKGKPLDALKQLVESLERQCQQRLNAEAVKKEKAQ